MSNKKVRVRSKRLDRLDEAKLMLAVYLMTRDLVEDKTTLPADRAAVPERPVEPGEEAA
jgi:hypothetical protein